MKTAIIYIRVSTDEQAAKGYSQRSQSNRLQQYCQVNKIKILRVFSEDFSAKTFKRPEWITMIDSFKKDKLNRPNLLLFTQWDRFSRNTVDTYSMIAQLKGWNIEPKAIEQPLDMNVPESKFMLAMYIVNSEVENERRSINVKHGMYRARQEGQWIGQAPIGYIYRVTPGNKRVLMPSEPEALLIRNAFFQISEGTLPVSVVYGQLVSKGFKCCRSHFWNLLKNPVYCGKIRLPVFGNIASYNVQGNHPALVSEDLFDQVQRILLHKGRGQYSKESSVNMLPLKGLLYCPICKGKLTGSGSVGYSKRYYYYHCNAPCGYRIRADKVNDFVVNGLDSLSINSDYLGIYEMVYRVEHEKIFQSFRIDQAYISKTIEKLIDRSSNAKQLLYKGKIESEDFLTIKSDCEEKIECLSRELYQTFLGGIKKKNTISRNNLSCICLKKFYEHGTKEAKWQVVDMLFVKPLIFNISNFKANMTAAAQVIFGNELRTETGSILRYNNQFKYKTDQPFCEMVLEIEKRNNRTITMQDAKGILSFLAVFVKFLIQNRPGI